MAVTSVLTVVCAALAAFTALSFSNVLDLDFFSPLNVLYALGSIKILITLTKYIPQVVLNFSRKSTDGWSVDTFVLDFMGGSLSLVQILVDC